MAAGSTATTTPDTHRLFATNMFNSLGFDLVCDKKMRCLPGKEKSEAAGSKDGCYLSQRVSGLCQAKFRAHGRLSMDSEGAHAANTLVHAWRLHHKFACGLPTRDRTGGVLKVTTEIVKHSEYRISGLSRRQFESCTQSLTNRTDTEWAAFAIRRPPECQPRHSWRRRRGCHA